MYKIGIIGGGNMGEAIIASSIKRFFIHVSEKNEQRRQYLKQTYKLIPYDIPRLAQISDIIILAVKPQDAAEVLKELARVIKKETLVISIAAGITSGFIEDILGKKNRVIRTMPNMPALIGEGITAVSAGKYAQSADTELACRILSSLGKTVIVEEKLIDAVTAVSGSGPAYVFLFMEYIIKAARSLGLSDDLAADLVKQTFLGSVNLLMKKNLEPGILRAKVTSKGGTTQAAVKVFEESKFEKIIEKALLAAKKRSKALSK